MSKKHLQRIEVLTEVLAGRRTTGSASCVLNVSVRQEQRLLARYGDGGGAALIHKSRGRPASNTINAGVRDYVLELVRQNYRDFGPTLASEALLERHGVEVSRETLRKWMVEAELWLSRKQRRTFHVKVLTNSEKDGYKKRPRQVYGPDYIEANRAPAAVDRSTTMRYKRQTRFAHPATF